MAGFTTYAQQRLLDHITGRLAYPLPATYAALYTSSPTDAGGGAEVTGAGYARAATAGLWSAAAGTSIVTSGPIAFAAPTAAWGVITHFGVFDAPAGGNLLFWGALTDPKTVNGGDAAPTFTTGNLILSLD